MTFHQQVCHYLSRRYFDFQSIMGRTCQKDSTFSNNIEKCSFVMTNIKYLGFIIDSTGIHVYSEKVNILKYWPSPQNIHELRSFLGLENFHRWFILGFSHIVWPLNQLTKGNGKTVFKWTLTQYKLFSN